MAEEKDKVIPQGVFDRANEALRSAGTIFTDRERKQMGLPRFPFGGATSTSMDVAPSFGSEFNAANVQYERDRWSRMANRYTMPMEEITRVNPFGSRLQNTSYVNPILAGSIEQSNQRYNEARAPIGQANSISTSFYSPSGKMVTEEIMSPAGFAQTTLTPEQVDARATARYEAEQAGLIPRTPEQQQAALDLVRANAQRLNQQRTDWVAGAIAQANPTTYTTPSGSSIVAPTDRFGNPIQSFVEIYKGSSAANQQRLKAMRDMASAARTVGPSTSSVGLTQYPTTYSNTGANARRSARNFADREGLPRPTNLRTQELYENEQNRRNMINVTQPFGMMPFQYGFSGLNINRGTQIG